ncbi:MarR family winged helix-turn-helix transcriptional regulator [Brevibacterium sp. RIT 803]|uniref:MarR family winged helix-turn-helix transcriptional regulator n=1 Tax=Brevibacterium sp. RIT 803 TaxID=2810210 RepID=UPI0020796FAA|nr:MarR family winged helix-turn-helix transcriptional regulator [Brevibacterium sp. RIT 803]
MSNQGDSDQGADNASQRIAEALTRLQWRRGPGGGPRGFGPPGGVAGFSGHPGFGGPGRGDFPFGRGRHPHGSGDESPSQSQHDRHEEDAHGDGRRHGSVRGRHEDEHDWKGRFGAHFGGRAQLRLLIALAQAGRSLGVSAIGESIGVDQPRASRLVSQGVDLGLLQREADPDDARRTLIALTEKGRAISNRFRGAQRESVDLALDGFTDDERALLAQLLSRLADAWPR